MELLEVLYDAAKDVKNQLKLATHKSSYIREKHALQIRYEHIVDVCAIYEIALLNLKNKSPKYDS